MIWKILMMNLTKRESFLSQLKTQSRQRNWTSKRSHSWYSSVIATRCSSKAISKMRTKCCHGSPTRTPWKFQVRRFLAAQTKRTGQDLFLSHTDTIASSSKRTIVLSLRTFWHILLMLWAHACARVVRFFNLFLAPLFSPISPSTFFRKKSQKKRIYICYLNVFLL